MDEKIKKPMDEETALKDMSPEQKEQLEKLKAMYEERVAKLRFKVNLKNREIQIRKAKRAKASKVAKKQRKINRGRGK